MNENHTAACPTCGGPPGAICKKPDCAMLPHPPLPSALTRQEAALERTPLGQNFIVSRDDLQALCAMARASFAQGDCGNPPRPDVKGTITDPRQVDVLQEAPHG